LRPAFVPEEEGVNKKKRQIRNDISIRNNGRGESLRAMIPVTVCSYVVYVAYLFFFPLGAVAP
jgi:hypothetical protein